MEFGCGAANDFPEAVLGTVMVVDLLSRFWVSFSSGCCVVIVAGPFPCPF
jgi:hypothetical protein